jgi:hypothetical protein
MPVSPFTVYDTTYVLEIKTDSYSMLRYSTEDKPYDQMENIFTTTGKRNHSVTFSCLHGMNYTYYLRGIDIYANAMDTSAVINFSVDTTKHIVNWTSLSYDDSQWNSGTAPLSNINDTSTATLLSTVTTAYFRKKITIDSTESIPSIVIWIKGHDAAIFYANGQEHLRVNLLAGAEITYGTYAMDSSLFTKRTTSALKNLLHNGENIIAVEVHMISGQNRHLSFDSKLTGGSVNINYPYGTAWNYYAEGNMPSNQVQDKPTEVALGMEGLLPDKITLYPNYPNPFNPSTVISYYLPGVGTRFIVTLKIYDLLGREVTTLVNGVRDGGYYRETFDGSRISSGVYFVRLTARPESNSSQAGNSLIQVKKMLLMK